MTIENTVEATLTAWQRSWSRCGSAGSNEAEVMPVWPTRIRSKARRVFR